MIESQLNIPRLVMIFACMAGCCAGLILILIKAVETYDYAILLAGFVPLGFLCWAFYVLRESNQITVEDDIAIIKSVFGNTKRIFKVSELINWIETHVDGKYNSYDKLLLIGMDFELKLRSLFYTNYMELKFALTRFKIKQSI